MGHIGACTHNPPARPGTAKNLGRSAGGRRRRYRNGNVVVQQDGEDGAPHHPSINSLCPIEIEVSIGARSRLLNHIGLETSSHTMDTGAKEDWIELSFQNSHVTP